MARELYGHPLSSYHQKALVGLYEAGVEFTLRMLDPDHPENGAALAKLTPTGKFSVLVDGAALSSKARRSLNMPRPR